MRWFNVGITSPKHAWVPMAVYIFVLQCGLLGHYRGYICPLLGLQLGITTLISAQNNANVAKGGFAPPKSP